MATVPVYDIEKNKVSDIELSDDIFNTEVKEYLIHEMVRYQRAARRQGTAKTIVSSLTARSRKPLYAALCRLVSRKAA